MIVVFGSLNVDFVTRVERLPASGETVLGPGFETHPGGKGANQALAAARAGADVIMVGAVGDDALGPVALALLVRDGVDVTHVAATTGPTGAAFITVDARGQNQIVVASGANRLADAAALSALAWRPRDILLLQGEVPPAQNLAAARIARAAGGRVILNPAPIFAIEPALLEVVDILVLNEHEALALASRFGWDGCEPDAICERLCSVHGLAAIATLGAAGAVGWWDGIRRSMPSPEVAVVDTTAAGDAFVGGLAAALDRGFGFTQALQYALAGGALACTVAGAQPSLPWRPAIEALVGDKIL
jgi:ribokinase